MAENTGFFTSEMGSWLREIRTAAVYLRIRLRHDWGLQARGCRAALLRHEFHAVDSKLPHRDLRPLQFRPYANIAFADYQCEALKAG